MAIKPRKKPPRVRKPDSPHSRNVQFEFTEDILKEIEVLAGRGLTNEQIFNYYGVGKNFWYESKQANPEIDKAFQRGKSKTISMVSGKLMEKIRQGNLSAIIFYLKTQARWSEHSTLGIEGGDKPTGAPLVITVNDPVEASRIYQQIMIGS